MNGFQQLMHQKIIIVIHVHGNKGMMSNLLTLQLIPDKPSSKQSRKSTESLTYASLSTDFRNLKIL